MYRLIVLFLAVLSASCSTVSSISPPMYATSKDIYKVCPMDGVRIVYSTPDAISAEGRARGVPVQAESFTDLKRQEIWVPIPEDSSKATLFQKPNALFGYEVHNYCLGGANDTLGR